MKSGKLISATALLVALAIPVSLAAQEHPTKHHRYKLVDMGTLGGPASYASGQEPGAQYINNRGMFAGYADTSTPDPFAPNCFNTDCFVSHTFRWQDGVLTDLGAIADSSGGMVANTTAQGEATIMNASQHSITITNVAMSRDEIDGRAMPSWNTRSCRIS